MTQPPGRAQPVLVSVRPSSGQDQGNDGFLHPASPVSIGRSVKRGRKPRRREAVLIGAGAASLIAVAFTLVQAGSADAPARRLLSALAIGSVALAWTSIHTVYVLRYARSYCSPPDGGIDLHGETPEYLDFAYLALAIGMCFQVSDTDLAATRVRRCALHHASCPTYSGL